MRLVLFFRIYESKIIIAQISLIILNNILNFDKSYYIV